MRDFVHVQDCVAVMLWLLDKVLKDEAKNKPESNFLDVNWDKTAAYNVGFKSVAHFSNAFQERYGERPSAFASRHRVR